MVVTGRDTATDVVNGFTLIELHQMAKLPRTGWVVGLFRGDLASPGLPRIGTIHLLQTDYQESSEFPRLNLW
jgi:hypothetical protein